MRASPALVALAAASLLLGAPATSRAGPPAPDPAEQGFVLSARGAWTFPFGELSGEGDPSLAQVVERKTPVWLEVGYRFDPRFRLGLFLEFAPVRTEAGYCLDDCGGTSTRFGADVQFHLVPRGPIDPWIGLGVAFEFLDLAAAVDTDGDGVGDTDGELGYAGFELPVVELGLDVVLGSRFRVGPFVAYCPGQFTSVEVDVPGSSSSRTRIRDRALHAWLQAGLKVAFDL